MLQNDGAKERRRGTKERSAREEDARREKTSGESDGKRRKECANLRTHPPNLPIVKRWGSRMGNYWRVFFLLFSKKTRMGKRDGELLEMLLVLHEFQNLHTRVTCE